MAIELPSEVAFFLNMIGVPYPDINEDDVRTLAEHVRTFATQVEDTHNSATGVINDMGSVYSGYSYEQLVASWARMSSTHMNQLADACKIVEQALYAAATVITVVKVAVLAELAALAASYAAVMVTPPLAPSGPILAAAARRLCEQMQQALIGYIVAEVLGRAIEPLENAIDDMIKGIVYDATRHALGVPAPSDHPTPLRIEPDEVQRYAKVLDEHADDIMQYAATFAENVSTLDFTTPTRFDDSSDLVAPDRSSPPAVLPPYGPDGTTGAPSWPRQLADSMPGVTAPPELRSVVPAETDSARAPLAGRDGTGMPGVGGQPGGGAEAGNRMGQPADNSGDRTSAHAGAADRTDPRLGSALPPSESGPAQSVSSPERSGELPVAASPVSTGQLGVPHAGVGASHDAVSGEPTHSAIDSEARRMGWESGPGAAAIHAPAVDDPAATPPAGGGAPPSRPGDAKAASATPWGRGRAPTPKASTSKPSRAKGARPAAVRAPVVTPWTKTGRTREVPAAVDAPATRPSLRRLRQKSTESGKVAPAGAAADGSAPVPKVAPAGPAADGSAPVPKVAPAGPAADGSTPPRVTAPTVEAPRPADSPRGRT
ncbi:hypothetical protein AB0B25_28335 [Nocardia sp. NPDC049190]|uniref:WXG100 family type VII secretion target n=1 Tax=Nocardia sp. NPDC049190 TaxID=3155650 RepID=UPI003407D194